MQKEKLTPEDIMSNFIIKTSTDYKVKFSGKQETIGMAKMVGLMKDMIDADAFNSIWPFLSTAYYLGAIDHKEEKSRLILP